MRFSARISAVPAPAAGTVRAAPRRGAALLATACSALLAAGLLAAPAAAAPWDGPARTFPAKYDLRTQGRVSPVTSQDHHSTCWVHAAMGSLESCLLPGSVLGPGCADPPGGARTL